MNRVRERLDNFWLGVANGALVNAGEAFYHSGLVLAPFLAMLGAHPVVIGLVPAIRVGMWYIPQLLVANMVAHQTKTLPVYHRTSFSRVMSLVVMTIAVFLAGAANNGVIIAIVLGGITLNAIAGGIGGVPFADVVAKVVPHNRLGTFWALRNSIGGVLALGAGFLLRYVLDSDMAFPTNFGLIFAIGTAISATGYIAFSLIKEPEGVAGEQQPFIGVLRGIPALLKADTNLRFFLSARFFGLGALLAEPFFAVYAINVLGAPASIVGIWVIWTTLSTIVSNLIFRFPANRGSNVFLIRFGYIIFTAMGVSAFFISDWRIFFIVFMLTSAGNAAVSNAAQNILYVLAPQGQRAMYIGLANTVLGIPALLPIFAGILVPFLGYRALFLVAALMAVAAFGFTLRLGGIKKADRAAAGRS